MTSVELLAPARNLSTAREAILHGADAVYIGAPRFGARAAASNSLDEIGELVRYAHIYNVRVYVTLNTILFDDELEDARQLVIQLHALGVDALIVQDMALLMMDLPPIALHASTQMDNRTADKVRWLQQLGFQQTVLARELSIDEIRDIHRQVPEMPLEVFVHGATCVCYNGQCYASQHCFGRSANRGECAQFCRLPFDLVDADGNVVRDAHNRPVVGRHLLSLHDMNRSDHLEELLDAGAVSLKIEGRLKDEAYVKNTVAHYRQRLDEIIRRRPNDYQRSSVGRSIISFTPQLERTFNRGFQDYFLHGRTPNMVQQCSPKSMGQPVGHVKEVRRNCFTVSGTASFANGDGLCFVDRDGHLQGFRVNRVEGNCLYPLQMPVGLQPRTQLFRNYDQAFNTELSRPTAQRKISVTWHLRALPSAEGSGEMCIKLTCEDGVSIERRFPTELNVARTPQHDNIMRQLSRLGDTPFETTDVELAFTEEWFLPSSLLAQWRRDMVEQLVTERLHHYNTTLLPSSTSTSASSVLPLGGVREGLSSVLPLGGDREGLSALSSLGRVLSYHANVSNHLAREFYLRQGAQHVDMALEAGGHAQPGDVLMTLRYCPRHELGLCPKQNRSSSTSTSSVLPLGGVREGLSSVLPLGGVRGGLLSLSSLGKIFPLRFDCRHCLVYVLKMLVILFVCSLTLTLSSCYYRQQRAEAWMIEDSTQVLSDEAASSPLSSQDGWGARRHYSVGYNFIVQRDTLPLCTEIPSRAQLFTDVPDSVYVFQDDVIVVAQIEVVPEDAQDSIWVKVARDQQTQGWVREHDLLPTVSPDDPISIAIYLFSGNHVWGTFLLVAVLLLMLALQNRKLRREGRALSATTLISTFRLSPFALSSPYPLFLWLTMAGSAVFYASMQLFVPHTWAEFYFHPTLNPFAVPALLGAFLFSVWLMLLFFLATVDDAFRQLSKFDAPLYLFGIVTSLALIYLFFSLTTLIYLGYPLFVLFAVWIIRHYYLHIRPRYRCGQCGKPIHDKSTCPYCGARNE